MGVTLERVQNKFACIIGELCSEPDILSEFAIWLDLRLAEYKAKGAIQLECSGETPDPSWLRGHKKPPKRIKSDLMQRLHHYDPATQYNEDVSQDVSERLSPEIVVVKEELAEGNDVFPVSIHRHDVSVSNRNHARKRSSADGGSMGHSGENSPFKMQRLSPSTSTLEPVNESLMSIITENTADDSADMTANITADFSNIDSSNLDNSSYMIPSSNPVASTSGGESTDQQAGSNSDFSAAKAQAMHDRVRQLGLDKMLGPSRVQVQSRMGAVEGICKRRVQDIAGAVATIERWINQREGILLHLEELPAAELNNYLTAFFPTFKKINGLDYDFRYVIKFRCCLERFLKHQKYPYCTRTAREFETSQKAFVTLKTRLQQSQRGQVSEVGPQLLVANTANKTYEHFQVLNIKMEDV